MPNNRNVEPRRIAAPRPEPDHAIAASMRGKAGRRAAPDSSSHTRSIWTTNPVAAAASRLPWWPGGESAHHSPGAADGRRLLRDVRRGEPPADRTAAATCTGDYW